MHGIEGIIALFIPIISMMVGVIIAMWAIYWGYRRKKETLALLHQERMAAIEKGLEVPPLPEHFGNGQLKTAATPRRYLLKGLIWTFVGLGILGAFLGQSEKDTAMFGLIPAGIGVAYLLYYFVAGKKEAEALEAARTAETNRPKMV